MSEDFAGIVIIKRSGADGPRFPLRRNECLFGRDAACDLRVQLPGVALEHAKVCRSENREFYLENLTDCETMINGNLIEEPVELSNLDIFSIAGRSFRFEYSQPKRKSLEQKILNVSKNNSGRLMSPLKEVNRVVKDSPRNPLPRRTSLRESLGKLRRSSVPFQEVEEPANTPEKTEQQQVCVVNPISRALSPTNTPLSTKKYRKRVSFGPQLSPEQFDKALPVATPIRKGATPRRLSVPLSKPCLSPARRRYSIATPSFVSKIEEEAEESDETSDEEDNPPKPDSPAVEIVELSHVEFPKLATPLRTEIKEGKKLRQRKKKMATPMRNAIKQGFRLKATKNKLNTPLRSEIQAGRKLKPTNKRLNTPVRKAIESRPKLRSTRMKMPTPVRKAIEEKPSLRQTKKVQSGPLQEDIKTGRKFLRIKRRTRSELQDEIVAGKELKVSEKKMGVELKAEIVQGIQLRPIRKRMVTMLQEEIKSGIELSKTKQSLKTPLRKEIESGVNLRNTKRRMAAMLQDEIKSGIQLSKTKQSLKTPLRKEIESGVNLRNTKRRMATMLQDEIKSGIELSKTKQSLKTPLRKEIESGVNLRNTKPRMATMLQDEIKSGIELSKTKQSLKTPLRKEIESGVHLRKTKRRMATMLQNEIESGIELSKTKQSLKTPLRKEIESGVQLKSTKDKAQPEADSKTPKRRLSSVEGSSSGSARKKLKTPSKTPQQAGFFPSSRSKTRSISRRKSTKKPSYAEILKRSKLVAKRRLSTKPKNVFEFGAEQKISTFNATTMKATATTTKFTKVKNKTPSRRKSQARSKMFDGKKADDWNVVVNKRKIKRIKRQRAVKPNQELDLDGLPVLFKTPKAAHTQARTKIEQDERTTSERPMRKCRLSSSPGESVLYGVAKLMKTPKVKKNNEPDYEGVAELFEVFEMSSPIEITGTPSLRRASDRVNIVTPLTINKTPSLRVKESASDVVFPLQLSSTPSLRKGAENLTVASAEEPQRTPSLRRVSESLTVALAKEAKQTPSLRSATNITVVAAEVPTHTPSLKKAAGNSLTVASAKEAKQTPSLRRSAMNVTVVAAEIPTHTPSLKKAAGNISFASPLHVSLTPALQSNAQKIIVVTSPSVQRTCPSATATGSAETPRLSSTWQKQSETVAVVSPFPVQPLTSTKVQPTPPSVQRIPATIKPSPPVKPTLPTANPSPPLDEEPSKAAKRSKRKVEPDTLPAAKRPRRTASRNNTAKDVLENVKSETKPSSGRASTRSSKTASRTAVTSKRQVQKRTSARAVKHHPVAVDAAHQLSEVVDIETQEEVEANSGRTTRASRIKPTNEKAKSQALSNAPPKASTTSGNKQNVAGIPETPQPMQFTRTKLDPIVEVPTPASSLRCSSITKPLFVKVPEMENQRSSRSRRDITTVIEEVVEPIIEISSGESSEVANEDTVAKRRVTRAKRTTRKNVGKSKTTEIDLTIPAVILKQNATEIKRASRNKRTAVENDEKVVADESLEPVTKTTRATRSRRQPVAPKKANIATKEPEVVEEAVEAATKEKRSTRSKGEVNEAVAGARRKPRGKTTSPPETKDEKSTGEKRVTRAKRGIAVVVAEENLPAPKRQKKTEETAVDDNKKVDVDTLEQEKPQKPRQTRTAQGQKVVEEITISNTKTTRRKKPVVKEIEIVEETVVKYTRTTRRRPKAVQENVSLETPVEVEESGVEETVEEGSGSRRNPRTTRQRRGAVQEKQSVEISVGKEKVKSGGRQSKRVKTHETEQEPQRTGTTDNKSKRNTTDNAKKHNKESSERRARSRKVEEDVPVRVTRSRRGGK